MIALLTAYYYLAIWAGPLFWVLYRSRCFLLSPWGKYISHTETKAGVFMVVRHVHWYPPFSDYETTWFTEAGSLWVNERTGYCYRRGEIFGYLPGMVLVAKARMRETEELGRL